MVTVPGIDGSDAAHWQTLWERQLGVGAVRLEPSSWTEPDLDDWCDALDRRIPQERPSLLVAHSLGCLAVAHWLTSRGPGPVRGAVLVAPPDAGGASFPAAAASFAGPATASLPVPGLVIRSDDDPYCGRAAAERLAAGWRVPVVSVGRAGHINSSSGLGDWAVGRNLVTAFRAGLGI